MPLKPGSVCDVVYPKPRTADEVEGTKKYWYPVIGKAFVAEGRIDIRLDSLPLPAHWDGRLVIFQKD